MALGLRRSATPRPHRGDQLPRLSFRQSAPHIADALAGMLEHSGQERGSVNGIASHGHKSAARSTQHTCVNLECDIVADKVKDPRRIVSESSGKVRWIDMCQTERPRNRQLKGTQVLPRRAWPSITDLPRADNPAGGNSDGCYDNCQDRCRHNHLLESESPRHALTKQPQPRAYLKHEGQRHNNERTDERALKPCGEPCRKTLATEQGGIGCTGKYGP